MPLQTVPPSPASSQPVRRRCPAWLYPAALALLPFLIFFPVSVLRSVFFHGDIQAYFYPYHVLPAALLTHGEAPLWNPFAFSGMPLLADGQTALFHPASWLFFALPAGAALNYAILSQFSIAGVGMFWLLRTLGLQRLPAWFGAVTYMFCGCMTARVVHLSIMGGAALLPWALACVERAFREQRGSWSARPPAAFRATWLAVSAAVIAAQVFAGHPQVPVYTALMLGLYALVRGIEYWRDSASPGWMCRLPLVVSGVYVLGGGLAAIQLVPWAEAGALSTRAAGASFDMVFNTSMARSEWLLQLFPFLYGSLSTGVFGDQPSSPLLLARFVEHSAYVGILPLGLAVYGFLSLVPLGAGGRVGRPVSSSVVFFALLALLGLLLAVGWGTPLAHVVYRTPILGKLRAVERALVLVNLAVAGLAAFGVQRLAESGSPIAWRRRWSLAAIGAGVAVIPVAVVILARQAWFQRGMSLPREATANLQLDQPNAAVPVMLAMASAALLLWWSRRAATRVTLGVAAGLVMLDLGGYAALFNPTTDAGFYDTRPDVLRTLPSDPGQARKATYLPRNLSAARQSQALLAMSWGMVYGVEDVNGFNSLQTRRYTDYVFGTEEGDVSYGLLRDDRLLRPENPVLSSLNVRYLLVPAGTSPRIGDAYRLVWDGPEVDVYENTLAYPRAFFAHAVRGMTDASAVLKAVTADGFDGRRLAIVETETPPALPVPAGEDDVTLTTWSPNRLALACTTATPRLLVLSEMFYPGWRAAVDGTPTEIYRTNYLFRGVVVPAGRHAVTFEYRPRSVPLGAAVSGAAVLAALAVLAAGRRRRQKIV